MARDRILKSDLEYLVSRLNAATGRPQQPYENGVANIGNYHLSWAYGGVKLHEMVTDGGGIRNVLGIGYETKRKCYEAIQHFLRGVEVRG